MGQGQGQRKIPRVDVFCHVLPKGYETARWERQDQSNFVEHSPTHIRYVSGGKSRIENYQVLIDLDARFQMMEEFEGYRQVLSVAGPPVEVVAPKDSDVLAKLLNDGLAELVAKYPSQFAGAVASLGMDKPDAAARELDVLPLVHGTLNHAGPFPHIRLSISQGSAAGIEGGGEYGRLWREGLNKWQDVQFPGVSGPGKNKLWEVAIGTNVNGIRPKNFAELGGSWERSRSGVIHWGIGARSGFVYEVLLPEEWAKFNQDHKEAGGHSHIHTYFTTMDIETVDGRRTQLINKGRLTVLDDPQVRQVAAKYGDPDELLREIWIPAMPGINVPGNYRADYASDPVSYTRKEIAEKYNY